MQTIANIGQFKGNDILSIEEINAEAKFPKRVSFGVAKAQLILSQIAEIKKFVAEHGKSE